jgi:hypothetical protein
MYIISSGVFLTPILVWIETLLFRRILTISQQHLTDADRCLRPDRQHSLPA